MTPARDMRANSTSASPKACWHQKAGQRTIEINFGRPHLGMGETKDIQNQLERVGGPVVRPSYILVTLQMRALFSVKNEMRFDR